MGSDDGSTQNENVESTTENTELPTDIEQKIIKQIEYYFGDYNLGRDKFLKEQVKLDDGWIPLETLIKFNRLKILSTDFQQIVSALKKSPSKLMEINDDSSKVRRSPDKPLPENDTDLETRWKERCVYVKKFPEDLSLDELLEFFQKFGTIENIQMRRFYSSKKFRGSVFVTFSTKEDATKFLDVASVKYKEAELSRETREGYTKRKEHQFKKSREQKEKKQKAKEDIMENEQITKGCLLKLSELPDDLKWETLKAFFNEFSPVGYVDCQQGKTEATLRFSEEDGAKSALEKALASNEEKKLIISEKEVSARILDGEEEKSYWKEFLELKAKNRQRFLQRGRKGKRRPYENDNKNRDSHKRKRDAEAPDNSSEKKTKVENKDAEAPADNSSEKKAKVEEV